MFSPEFVLLVLSCRGDDDAMIVVEAERIIRGGGIDRERLYARAELLSVRPQMAKLVSILPPGTVPDSFRTRINKAYLDTVHDLAKTVGAAARRGHFVARCRERGHCHGGGCALEIPVNQNRVFE